LSPGGWTCPRTPAGAGCTITVCDEGIIEL
jgi:hypothetical protein